MYTEKEVMEFCGEEDVAFVKLTFADVFGKPKNISIPISELPRAFRDGVSFDGSAIPGFGDEARSDLLLLPDPETLTVLPWRSGSGRVARLLCGVVTPDGAPFSCDCRTLLKNEAEKARKQGVELNIGTEFEFYLFKTDAQGSPTREPLDTASYMDIAPEDKGEDVRREICLMLTEMGMHPESSHHEEGPSQHEIDFRFGKTLAAADNALTFPTIVRTCALRNGLYADFSPKPLEGRSGSGLHVNLSLASERGGQATGAFMAGLLHHIPGLTAFLNPLPDSYRRLGENKAPRYITWSPENRSQLIRIPAAKGDYARMELRSPDPAANPYIAFLLILRAGLDGMQKGMAPPEPVNCNLYRAERAVTGPLPALPGTPEEAVAAMEQSELVRAALPERVRAAYRARLLQ